MKQLACAMVCWAIVGCAQEPVQPPLTQKQPTSPELADARSRADVHAQLGAA